MLVQFARFSVFSRDIRVFRKLFRDNLCLNHVGVVICLKNLKDHFPFSLFIAPQNLRFENRILRLDKFEIPSYNTVTEKEKPLERDKLSPPKANIF